MGELLSGAEFGRRAGISKQAVSQAARVGRLPVASRDGRNRPLYEWPSIHFVVDVDQIDRAGDVGGRPARRQNGTPAPARPTASSGGEAGDNRERLLAAKVAHTEAQAHLNDLRLQERRGELISKEEAYQQGMELGAILLSQLQAWPARLSPVLASMVEADEHDFHQMLIAEVNEFIKTVRRALGLDPNLEQTQAATAES